MIIQARSFISIKIKLFEEKSRIYTSFMPTQSSALLPDLFNHSKCKDKIEVIKSKGFFTAKSFYWSQTTGSHGIKTVILLKRLLQVANTQLTHTPRHIRSGIRNTWSWILAQLTPHFQAYRGQRYSKDWKHKIEPYFSIHESDRGFKLSIMQLILPHFPSQVKKQLVINGHQFFQ